MYWNKWFLSRALRRFLGVGWAEAVSDHNAMGPWCRKSAARVALLLSMAPNLTSTQFCILPDWDVSCLATKKAHGNTWVARLTFPNLTRLRLIGQQTRVFLHIQNDMWQPALGAVLAATPNFKSLELGRLYGLKGRYNLPPRLTSLVLHDTLLDSDDLSHMLGTATQLERFCTYRHLVSLYGHVGHLTRSFLQPFSQLPELVKTLRSLDLHASVPETVPVDILRRLAALEVLCLNCHGVVPSSRPIGDKFLLVLLQACPNIRGLVLYGAHMIHGDELIRFAEAVSRRTFPICGW